MKKILEGEVTNIQQECKNVYRLEFKSALEKILPGQFLTILCPPRTLRRPLAVVDFKNGVLTVLLKIRGEGTKYLKNLKIGDKISFNAPLGQPFFMSDKKALLIGAGIGLAPLFYLNDELKKKGANTRLVSGFNADDEVIGGCDQIKVGGTILEDIPKIIEEFQPEVIYCCAPYIVLKLVAQMGEKYGILTYVALERVMACGIGVCRSCVIKVKKDGKIENRSICQDGPVFLGSEVVWE